MSILQKEVLCRGVDLGVPGKISEPETLAEFELLQQQVSLFNPVSKEDAERSRCELAAVAQQFAAMKPDVRNFSLKCEHRKVMKDLCNDKNLVITQPDKGRATVILRKDEYVKMMSILSNDTKFVRLGPCEQFDRTQRIELSLQSYLKCLMELKEISEDVYTSIAPIGSSRPRLYGLPKIHKPGVPLRPILSMCGSPQNTISKWLCDLLSPVVRHYGKRCVKDSFGLVSR